MSFDDDHAAAYVCCHVFSDERPVLLAHKGGDWIFACGADDHGQDEAGADWHLVGVGHLIERDASLDDVSDLPLGW